MRNGAAPDVSAEQYRARLFDIAYRMLGDRDEAEDAVQEGYLRWYGAERAAVAAPEAWLVAVVARVAIDRLRHRTVERRVYAGPWSPAPSLLGAADVADAADRAAELRSELSAALRALLERLAPEERAAFLLRHVFDAGYDEIARVLGRSAAAVRQVVHRARVRVRGGPARFAVPPAAHAELLGRFLNALAADDRATLLAVLDPTDSSRVEWRSEQQFSVRSRHGIAGVRLRCGRLDNPTKVHVRRSVRA